MASCTGSTRSSSLGADRIIVTRKGSWSWQDYSVTAEVVEVSARGDLTVDLSAFDAGRELIGGKYRLKAL